MSSESSWQNMVGVFLLPKEEDSKLLIKLSNKINEKTESVISLGEQSIPHITIAHFEAPLKASGQLKDVVSELKGTVSELMSAGLNFCPSKAGDETWVETSFLKSAALMQLQTKLLASDFGSKYQVLSGVGDAFRPHCTLALIQGTTTVVLNLDSNMLRRTFTDMQLIVGELGDNYTLRRILT